MLDTIVSIDSFHYFATEASFFETKILPLVKSGGYVYIMDVAGDIPFINEALSTDVTDQVKAKLGIK